MARAKPYEGTNYVQDEIAAMEEVRNQFKNPKQGSTDPFNGFGFGIIAYFKMLRFLLVTYAVLTVLAGYIIHIYWSGDTIKAHDKKSFFAIFTVGNLGFTQTECTIWFQGLEKEQKLECSRGTISSIKHMGIVPNHNGMVFKNGERVPMDFCGSPDMLNDDDDCSKNIQPEFTNKYNRDCKGKESCWFNAPSYVAKRGNSRCYAPESHVYVQYECHMSNEETKAMQHIAIKVILVACFMSLIYLLVIYYLESVTNLDFKLWDVSTCTAADFTVELTITPSMWRHFKAQQDNSLQMTDPLDQQIKKAIQDRLRSVSPILKGHENDPIDVAAVSIAYKNGQIIDLLT